MNSELLEFYKLSSKYPLNKKERKRFEYLWDKIKEDTKSQEEIEMKKEYSEFERLKKNNSDLSYIFFAIMIITLIINGITIILILS